jgi:hypothetical protein
LPLLLLLCGVVLLPLSSEWFTQAAGCTALLLLLLLPGLLLHPDVSKASRERLTHMRRQLLLLLLLLC